MNLAACYLAVAACVGVPHPPKMPRVVIVADVPHMDDGQARHGFVCDEYCLNPPPPCGDPAGCGTTGLLYRAGTRILRRSI